VFPVTCAGALRRSGGLELVERVVVLVVE